MESARKEQSESVWNKTGQLPAREPLPGNLTVKAAVIGAGMAGILTAYLLKKQGINVIVLEAGRTAAGQIKNTTAKITSQHGLFYRKLIDTLGVEKAGLYAAANEAAIEAYETIIKDEHIDCSFERLPSFLYSVFPGRKKDLEREGDAARSLGIRASFREVPELPFETAGAVCFENQAQFHPLEFIEALSKRVTVYEKTRVLRVKGHAIFTDRGTVTAEHIIFASHYPIVNIPGFYFTRMHQERSYVLALSGSENLHGMYYSADDNGLSLRWCGDTLLLGGGAHRTGRAHPGGEYQALDLAAKKYYPDCQITARWSAQDCMPHDGLPFIGKYSIFRPYWSVATGFKKWGMTASMLSAMILRDRICGLDNPWEALFSPQRFHLKVSAANLLDDLKESAGGLVKGAFHLPLKERQLQKGQAGIIRSGLHRYACYRDESGNFHKISARCPHLGCELSWNPAEKSWDCPCHGSRFDFDGNLIDNPAQVPAVPAKEL